MTKLKELKAIHAAAVAVWNTDTEAARVANAAAKAANSKSNRSAETVWDARIAYRKELENDKD